MFALVDASGMYASCEKVFDPSIRNKPVVVLSNNDGCIVAVCPIAKRLGVPKFEPYFKLKPWLDELGVVARSSNYELYADLSDRMMSTCARFAPDQYVYSIDETFLGYDGHKPKFGWFEHGMAIRRAVWKEVRLPVGVGFGHTLTLAKAANHASKKIEGFTGVAVIDDEHQRQHILKKMFVQDVWGVGRRISKRLQQVGINTAWQLSNVKPSTMRSEFSILLENTVHELNGQTRLSWDEVRSPKKQIYSTRSFGQRVTTADELRQSIVQHCSIVAEKLRKQGSLSTNMLVFAQSSIHDQDSFFKRSALHEFSSPTSDTNVMANACTGLIHRLYCPGVRYYKSGVGVLDLVEEHQCQLDMFDVSRDNKKLMTQIDAINHKFGKNTMFVGSKGIDAKFEMRREMLSKRYTTRLNELPVISCR